MAEDFSEISNKSIWVLLNHIVATVDVLKNELPFDYLTPSWHIEDGTDNFTVGVSGRWGKRYHHLTIDTHYLDAPPEPNEMCPPDCCALGTLLFSGAVGAHREDRRALRAGRKTGEADSPFQAREGGMDK
jgi:hypothetical protein